MIRFQKSGAAGFTLLEVLVVMSLLSLVMLGMGSALRTTAQTGERVDHRLLRDTDSLRRDVTQHGAILLRIRDESR